MGRDCRITLPTTVRFYDVQKVISRLVGAETTAESTGVIGLALIKWDNHRCLYHFEFGGRGNRGLIPRSTAFWIAVGYGLVDCFGGTVDHQDCDDSDCDYSKPEVPGNDVEDGPDWDMLQSRINSIEPLTLKRIKTFDQYAAYKGCFV